MAVVVKESERRKENGKGLNEKKKKKKGRKEGRKGRVHPAKILLVPYFLAKV
ncbi:conserved hypothetical protein [Ricinus communis]|uniref:Uncharacterized protein n=1 Tax=Ricinus communis TaxID=3988 RepID=B9T2I6_RICCO|nr:conserved hypothetical protein [Ricinus communis]